MVDAAAGSLRRYVRVAPSLCLDSADEMKNCRLPLLMAICHLLYIGWIINSSGRVGATSSALPISQENLRSTELHASTSEVVLPNFEELPSLIDARYEEEAPSETVYSNYEGLEAIDVNHSFKGTDDELPGKRSQSMPGNPSEGGGSIATDRGMVSVKRPRFDLNMPPPDILGKESPEFVHESSLDDNHSTQSAAIHVNVHDPDSNPESRSSSMVFPGDSANAWNPRPGNHEADGMTFQSQSFGGLTSLKMNVDLTSPPSDFKSLEGILYHKLNPDLFQPYKDMIHRRLDKILLKCNTRGRSEPGQKIRSIMCLRPLASASTYHMVNRVVGNDGNVQSPHALKKLLTNLIKWVLFNHAAFSEKVNAPQVPQLGERDLLMDWLFKQLFGSDTNDPILGEVNYPPGPQNFSPIQIHLIDYLHEGFLAEHSYDTSLFVIGIWCKQTFPESWNHHFENDEKFWMLMKLYTAQAMHSSFIAGGSKIPDPEDRMYEWGNISFHDLMKAMSSRMDTRAWVNWYRFNRSERSRMKKEPPLIENEIIEESLRIMKLNHKPTKRLTSNMIQDSLATLIRSERGKDHKEPVFVIRLVNQAGDTIPSHSMKIRLGSLLSLLRLQHSKIIENLILKNKNVIPDAHTLFLIWLKKILFDMDGSLPVFGVIKEDKGLKFGLIQRNLVIYFTKQQPKAQVAVNLAALLAYWYKNNYRDYWVETFEDETHFAEYCFDLGQLK